MPDVLGLVVVVVFWNVFKGVVDHFLPQHKTGQSDHYSEIIFTVVVLTAFEVSRIERKLDAMNTHGPAEVVVSGERE